MLTDVLLALFDLALVVGVAALGGALARRIGQPTIAGELVAVILIGPTVLGGQIEGVVQGAKGAGFVHELFPPAAVDVLTWTGTAGLVLYMLLIGMKIDPAPMVRRARAIATLAVAVLASAAVVAVVAAPWLRDAGGWMAAGATASAFTLALVAALGANGVPIVARILEERDLLRTEIGALVIAAAATITTIALLVSGFVVRGGDGTAAWHLAAAVAGGAVLLLALVRLGRSPRLHLAPLVVVVALIAVALAAGIAGKRLIGTALVGPLVVGIAVSSAGHAAAFVEARLGTLVRRALLPVFLGLAALHTDLRELGASVLAPALGLIAAVLVSKYAAGYGAARVAGL
ncbi:MAG: hypothetical protein QOJ89_4344, partial [bacterium]